MTDFPLHARYVLRHTKKHLTHCKQLMNGFNAARLNALCQSLWSVENPRRPDETVQAYARRQALGGQHLATLVRRGRLHADYAAPVKGFAPNRPFSVAALFRRCGVNLTEVRHLLRARPDPMVELIRHQSPAVLPPENRKPWPEEEAVAVSANSSSLVLAPLPPYDPTVWLDPTFWTRMDWPDPAITAAYRAKQGPEDLETVYFLYRRVADDEWQLTYVVEGDSALQKQVILQKGEDFWRQCWKTLHRWRNPPVWEESLAKMNQSIHWLPAESKIPEQAAA